MKIKSFVAAAAMASVFTVSAAANAATILALKVSDLAPDMASVDGLVDPYLDWVNTGGHNEGVAGATSLMNNGIDYKNSFVDTNWGDVLSVRVSVYNGGNEQMFIEFDAAGTTKSDFFAVANITASSYGLASFGIHNFFSIAGDTGIDRHWFVERNYGGCGNDRGHLVVLDGASAGSPCGWEASRVGTVGINTRGFLYAIPPVDTDADVPNWNTTADIGIGDVFAVHVTTASTTVPEPAVLGLLAVGGIGAAALRRRRH